MVARTLPLSFPAGTVNSVRSLCEFPSPTNAALVPFCGHDCARRPASFVLALFKSRENAPSTAAPAAGRITCLDLSSRATVGAAEVDPESQSPYCLSLAKLHMVSLALDCYSKVSSPPTPLVCAPAVRPPLGHHAQASASTTLVLHARNGVVHTLSVEP